MNKIYIHILSIFLLFVFQSSMCLAYTRFDTFVSYNEKDTIKNHKTKFKYIDVIKGGTIGNDTTKFFVKYDGLLLFIPEYNFVDGAWLGQKLNISILLNNKSWLRTLPFAYYTWGRNQFIFGSDFQLEYSSKNEGILKFSAASISEDFNPNGITRFDNAIGSALYRKSDNYFYLKKYLSIENIFITQKHFLLKSGLEIAKRSGLSNHANWGIWGNPHTIKPNIFSETIFDLTSYNLAISYSPGKFSFKEKKSIAPIFTIEYKEGFSSWQKNNSRYRKLRANVIQNIILGKLNQISYEVDGGSFLGSTKRTHFTDYQHFNTSDMFSISKWPDNTFVLLGNYDASTKDYWIQTKINYDSYKFLLTRIPLLRKYNLKESLHLKTLYTPDYKFYSEIGYSIDYKHLLNIGAYTSFHNNKFDHIGFRLSYILREILARL